MRVRVGFKWYLLVLIYPADALYEALLNAIYNAKERIWIVTPYFVPDENMIQALIIAHHKGVDVKLITPKNSDHLLADIAKKLLYA